jgi:vacuolar-type H+-ATPase subunit H
MEILDVLDNLEDGIERSITVPFSNKSLVDKSELLNILKEVRLNLPDDLKQAAWIREEKQKIIEKANEEAENILKEAEDKINDMVNDHEITKNAYMQANNIIESAQKSAKEIKNGTKQYADQILNKIEDVLLETLQVVQKNREELRAEIQKC